MKHTSYFCFLINVMSLLIESMSVFLFLFVFLKPSLSDGVDANLLFFLSFLIELPVPQ